MITVRDFIYSVVAYILLSLHLVYSLLVV